MTRYQPIEHAERAERPREDHYVHLHGASWADYQRLLAIRGERSSPRVTYLEGTLEIMTPSRQHESIKSTLGRLVEVWCLERDLEFSAHGSWTIDAESAERGVEPDECYVFGAALEPERPDLAIEVIWTSGGLDKLDVYRKLRVREVWFWRAGRVQPYALRDERYEAVEQSELLPGLDLAELASFVERPTTSEAVRAYRAAIRGR